MLLLIDSLSVSVQQNYMSLSNISNCSALLTDQQCRQVQLVEQDVLGEGGRRGRRGRRERRGRRGRRWEGEEGEEGGGGGGGGPCQLHASCGI